MHDHRAGDMGFGPVWQGHGVLFRHWAPAARTVTLVMPEQRDRRALPMTPKADGWFVLYVPDLAAGTRYGFRIDDGPTHPDPGSRFQPQGVDDLSVVVNPYAYRWATKEWRGRPWHEAVISEIHVGAYTPEGSFDGVRRRIGRLAELGVTALQLLPVAAFAGQRNWGFDTVLPYATASSYGAPDDLKALVDEAHQNGIMVLIDIVCDRFGPNAGDYPLMDPAFFLPETDGDTGPVIDYASRPVREFFIRNALCWLEEFRLDGLRIHRAQAIRDPSAEHILYELRRRIGERLGAERRVHLILDNDDNGARYLDRDFAGGVRGYTAQCNDDMQSAFEVALTGQADGVHADFAERPVAMLGRCLAQGFAFQGEHAVSRGRPRGEPSGNLPPAAFINFLDNHQRIGLRPGARRLDGLVSREALDAALALLLLAPMPPQLFMGEEWGADEPFPLFFDFAEDRIAPDLLALDPPPHLEATLHRAVLDWCKRSEAPYADRLAHVSDLIARRHRLLTPRLDGMAAPAVEARLVGATDGDPTGLLMRWVLGDNSAYTLRANFGASPISFDAPLTTGRRIFSTHPQSDDRPDAPAWYVCWTLGGGGASA